MGLGNYADATEQAEWMLNLQPFNVPRLLIAADLRVHYGDREGALEVLERAYAEVSPAETSELASIANRIAVIDVDLGKLDSAAQMLQRAYELFPDYPDTIRNRARVVGVLVGSEGNANAAPAVSSQPMTEETLAPASFSPVVFSPVPAALLLPHATGTERLIKNMQTRVQSNPRDP